MFEMFSLNFMVQAFIISLITGLFLSYLGIHVVGRGIVFVDLALGQISWIRRLMRPLNSSEALSVKVKARILPGLIPSLIIQATRCEIVSVLPEPAQAIIWRLPSR